VVLQGVLGLLLWTSDNHHTHIRAGVPISQIDYEEHQHPFGELGGAIREEPEIRLENWGSSGHALSFSCRAIGVT